jgi:hypothetical protein
MEPNIISLWLFLGLFGSTFPKGGKGGRKN